MLYAVVLGQWWHCPEDTIMASAPAPAVPSAPTAPAAPAPGNAPTPAAPDQSSARSTLRPIPPPPPLPGVLPDADSAAPPRDAAGTPPAGVRPRGPDGRFLSGDAATSSEPAAPDAGEHTQPQEGDTPPTPKFKFAGREYESQAQAEQAHRTLQGHFKPLMSIARSLGGIDKIVPHLRSAADSARGWQAEAQRLAAELTQYQNGTAQPAASPAPSNDSAPASEGESPAGVDWELYAEIRRLANEKGEPWKAEQWLMEQVQAAERTRYERLLDERLSPFTAAQEKAATVKQTESLFGQMATYQNADGTPAFPELHDESAAYEVGRIWASLGLPAEAAMTPQGALAAIAMYRMTKQARGASSDTARTVSTPVPPAPPAPAAPSDAAAAAGVDYGRTRPVSARGPEGQSAEAARILMGLRSVTTGSRNHLGFDA